MIRSTTQFHDNTLVSSSLPDGLTTGLLCSTRSSTHRCVIVWAKNANIRQDSHRTFTRKFIQRTNNSIVQNNTCRMTNDNIGTRSGLGPNQLTANVYCVHSVTHTHTLQKEISRAHMKDCVLFTLIDIIHVRDCKSQNTSSTVL